MKAFAHTGPGKFEWIDVEKPVLKQPYGVILKPIVVSPCTSDIHTLDGRKPPKQPDLIMGHECVAEVVQIGDGVLDFRPGDKVIVPAITPDWRSLAIQEGNFNHADDHFSGHRLGRTWNGVFAEMFALPDADTTLCHLPEWMNLKQGLMCGDVMTTGLTAAENANIKIGDTVCVMGIGPIGLMAIAGATQLGAGRIIAVGSRKRCVELAMHYGATDVIDYHDGNIAERVLEMTSGIGTDSVILAGGGDEVFPQAVDMVRYGIGTISNVNYFGGDGNLQIPKFSGGRGMAGKTIHMELCKGGRARIERMIRMIQYGRIDPEPLVTDVVKGWANLEQAFELMRDKARGTIKVMVDVTAK